MPFRLFWIQFVQWIFADDLFTNDFTYTHRECVCVNQFEQRHFEQKNDASKKCRVLQCQWNIINAYNMWFPFEIRCKLIAMEFPSARYVGDESGNTTLVTYWSLVWLGEWSNYLKTLCACHTHEGTLCLAKRMGTSRATRTLGKWYVWLSSRSWYALVWGGRTSTTCWSSRKREKHLVHKVSLNMPGSMKVVIMIGLTVEVIVV